MEGKYNIPATRYLQAFKRNGVDHFVTVPDWVQLSVHKHVEEGVPGIKLVTCCNEEQAVVTSAGLRIGGKNPIVVVQNQGFHACVNATRAIGLDANIPIVFLIGQFGREFSNFGRDQQKSRAWIVRLVQRIAQSMDMPCFLLETESDMPKFDEAFKVALDEKGPVAIVVGAPTGWD